MAARRAGRQGVCARGIEIDYRDVNRAIVRHGLQAARWDNWYVRRSAADAFDWASIKGGSGAGHELPGRPAATPSITLVLAVGMSYATIAAGMGGRAIIVACRTG